MAKQTINIGSAGDDGTGDPLRTAFDKTNDNFDELYTRTEAASETASGIVELATAAEAVTATDTARAVTPAGVKAQVDARAVPRFHATKGGSDQTLVADNVSTLITFGTEVVDIGGHFTSNGWTPPAGPVMLGGHYHFTGTIGAGAVVIALLMKNGSPLAQWNFGATVNQGAAGFHFRDEADGDDVYTFNAQIDLTSGTATILGAASLTYFYGHCVRG